MGGGHGRGQEERVAAPFIMLTTLSHLLRDIVLTALKMEPDLISHRPLSAQLTTL